MAIKASAAITLAQTVDVKKVTRYYLLQSSTLSTPAKPTAYPPTDGWDDTEPSYTSGSTNSLYFTDCTELTDGTWEYSSVSLSSAYEAAKQAWNKAAAVETRVTSVEQKTTDSAIIATVTQSSTYTGDIDRVSNVAETAQSLAERNAVAAQTAQNAADQAQSTANNLATVTETLQTQITQTASGLSIIQNTATDLEGRVKTIESGVHINGAEIGIYTTDSPYKNTITNEGWIISENGTAVITCAETKLTAPRVQVTDALIIGILAWKPGSDKHLRLLKYGR